MMIYERALAHEEFGDLRFPKDVGFSSEARDFILNLLHPKRNKRLGVRYPGPDGIRKHHFYNNFDWDAFTDLKLPPPKLQVAFLDVKEISDQVSSNPYNPNLDQNPDDSSGWSLKFGKREG